MEHKSIPILAVLTILFASFFPFVAALADDKTCTLKVELNKVYVTVWDEDFEEDRRGKIFEGWLESGEELEIQSTTGFIGFNFKEADNELPYGNFHKECKGGNTIRVP